MKFLLQSSDDFWQICQIRCGGGRGAVAGHVACKRLWPYYNLFLLFLCGKIDDLFACQLKMIMPLLAKIMEPPLIKIFQQMQVRLSFLCILLKASSRRFVLFVRCLAPSPIFRWRWHTPGLPPPPPPFVILWWMKYKTSVVLGKRMVLRRHIQQARFSFAFHWIYNGRRIGNVDKHNETVGMSKITCILDATKNGTNRKTETVLLRRNIIEPTCATCNYYASVDWSEYNIPYLDICVICLIG